MPAEVAIHIIQEVVEARMVAGVVPVDIIMREVPVPMPLSITAEPVVNPLTTCQHLINSISVAEVVPGKATTRKDSRQSVVRVGALQLSLHRLQNPMDSWSRQMEHPDISVAAAVRPVMKEWVVAEPVAVYYW